MRRLLENIWATTNPDTVEEAPHLIEEETEDTDPEAEEEDPETDILEIDTPEIDVLDLIPETEDTEIVTDITLDLVTDTEIVADPDLEEESNASFIVLQSNLY